MPSYEMPLEEMKEYRGSSPCPKDFDTYWSDALAELDAVKPEPVLKPAAFQADVYKRQPQRMRLLQTTPTGPNKAAFGMGCGRRSPYPIFF